MVSESPCNEIRLNLFPYLKGELSGEAFESVRSHLAACESCRSESEEMNNTLEILTIHSPPVTADERTWDRLSTRIVQARSTQAARMKTMLIAGASLIAVFGALCLGWLLIINDQVVGALRDTLQAVGLEMAWLTDSPISNFLAPLLFIFLCSIMTLLLSPFLLKPFRKKRTEPDLTLQGKAVEREG